MTKGKGSLIRIVLVIVVAVVAAIVVFVQTRQKVADLSGEYYMVETDTASEVRELLEADEFYDEEIALIDLESFHWVRVVRFDKEGNYRFDIDVEETQQYVLEFYTQAFKDMYEGRTTLNDAYGLDFTDMTEEEFYDFYVEIYQFADYDAMMDYFVETAFDYDSLRETGTYVIDDNRIECTVTGETVEEYVTYELDGDELTLGFADGDYVYTRRD